MDDTFFDHFVDQRFDPLEFHKICDPGELLPFCGGGAGPLRRPLRRVVENREYRAS